MRSGMTEVEILAFVRQILVTGLVVSAPLLLLISVVGLGISIVQALTQVQEQAVAFVAKLLLSAGTLFLIAPWMMGRLAELLTQVIMNLGRMAR